ncbi:hypothetical protein BD779DRAFT_1803025 [Infundibulicybe gibba]|nr:hypothetical protein BD779DRAFT_1803025 [Infundibulicybe gibba]
MSSREDSSTTSAYHNRESRVNVSADATGPEEATFPALKKRRYSELHDPSRDAVDTTGDFVSTTSKRLDASRPLMTTTINQTDSALSPENGNITPAACQPYRVLLAPSQLRQLPSTPAHGRRLGRPSVWFLPARIRRDPDFMPATDLIDTCDDLGDQVYGSYHATRRDPDLMPAIDLIATRLKQGGRLVYIGPGATGWVLDAADLPRKFSASPASFIRLLAGGAMAVDHAARDPKDAPDAVADLGALMSPLTPSDALIGVVTSRSMTYVLAGMSHARALGALTIGITYTNWSTPGDPGVCECVVECDLRLEREGESSEIERDSEIKSVLIKLSEKLGGSTRASEGMVETGVPDERDKNAAHRPRTSARAISNFRAARSRPQIANNLVAHTETEPGATVTEQERSEGLPSLTTPVLPLGSGHDTAISNQEPAC